MSVNLMNKRSFIIGIIMVLLFCAIPNMAQNNNAEDLMSRSLKAYYQAGDTLTGVAVMRLVSGSSERKQEMKFLRKNADEKGEQKYFVYFRQPVDVQGTTVMILKHTDKESDRWIKLPALNLVKRIAVKDRNCKFVGSDFSYDDVSGHNVNEDNHSLVKEEGGFYLVKSVPKDLSLSDYAYKFTWISKKTLLPMKEERYDKNEKLLTVQTLDNVRLIGGWPTPLKRTMKDMVSGHYTDITFTSIEYNLKIDDNIFSERYLKSPPDIVLK